MDAIFCEREISFLLMHNSADPAQILDEVLGEADALIRRLLEDRGVELPHLVIAVTLERQIVLRSNDGSDALRSFGEDLINFAVHWPNLAMTSPAFHSLSTIPIACKRRAAARNSGWADDHAYSSSVRHRTRDKNKLTTVRDRANTRASKAIAMRAPSLGRSYLKRALLRRRLHVASWVALLAPP